MTNRLSDRKIRPAELGRRRDVWIALSQLLLDTELRTSDLKWIASRLVASGYAWAEIEGICLYEVAPALFDKRHPPPCGSADMNPNWLEDLIRPPVIPSPTVYLPSLMRSAVLSAIMIVGIFVFARGMAGMSEASQTRRPSTL